MWKTVSFLTLFIKLTIHLKYLANKVKYDCRKVNYNLYYLDICFEVFQLVVADINYSLSTSVVC